MDFAPVGINATNWLAEALWILQLMKKKGDLFAREGRWEMRSCFYVP